MNTWATHAYDNDGNEINQDPYGVPTGVVPRVQYQLTPEDEVEIKRRQAEMVAAVEFTALGSPDPIAKAVDDYLLMGRKAKAWDTLRQRLFPSEARVHAVMDELLKPPA